MTDTAMTTATEPDGAPRVAGLDILRGIAILGILFMNINDMGGSLWASFGDVRHLGWTRADRIAWWLREVLANGTARCLLEMLFGVGMVILTDRAVGLAGQMDDAGRGRRILTRLFGPWPVMRAYYWRSLVLFAFGVVHVFVLLWVGDILHTYGLAAMVAFLFRRLGARWLLGIGLVMAMLNLGGGAYSLLTVPGKRAEVARLERVRADGGTLTKAQAKTLKDGLEARAKREKRKAGEAVKIVAEDRARTGDFASWAGATYGAALWFLGKGFELMGVWEAAGTMLIGAALYRWGIIQGLRSPRFYARTMAIGYAVGLGSRAIGAFQDMRFDDAPGIMWMMYEPARLATTLGHVSLAYLLLGTVVGARALQPFAAAGRTALTIYICQTLICLWVLYPPFALGLYGQQGWMALMLTALAVNVGLLWAANVYLRHYAIAPVEWAWRSMVARRRLPIRRGTAADRAGAAALPA